MAKIEIIENFKVRLRHLSKRAQELLCSKTVDHDLDPNPWFWFQKNPELAVM